MSNSSQNHDEIQCPDKSENIADDSLSDDQKIHALSIENTFSPKHDSSFNTFSPKLLMNSKSKIVGLKESLLRPLESS